MSHNKKACGGVRKFAWILVIIGALNWGLVGIAGFVGDVNLNLVDIIFGSWVWLENLVYVLVGLSALFSLTGCKKCKGGACSACANGTCAEHGGEKTQQM